MSPAVKRGMPPRILVVGLGNPDRGDDGIGPMIVRDLADRLPPDVAILARSTDVLLLISEWVGYDALVCVDAAMPMTATGRIHRMDLRREELGPEISTASTHSLGLIVMRSSSHGRLISLQPISSFTPSKAVVSTSVPQSRPKSARRCLWRPTASPPKWQGSGTSCRRPPLPVRDDAQRAGAATH